MKVLVILSFDLPDDHAADLIPDILQRIDPPALPFFDREVRVTTDPVASQLEAWLDEE